MMPPYSLSSAAVALLKLTANCSRFSRIAIAPSWVQPAACHSSSSPATAFAHPANALIHTRPHSVKTLPQTIFHAFCKSVTKEQKKLSRLA